MEVKTVTEDDKGNVNFSEDLLDLDSMYVTNFVKSESKYLEDEYEITRSEEYKEKERLSDDRYRMHMSGEKYGMSEKEKRNKIKLMKMLQKLLEVETVKPMTQTYYFVWETLFLNFLKMDENYTPFLDPNKTWTCFNDSSNRDQANEDIKNLDNLITTLASYGPEILNKNIINKCTSITQFFKQICDFYDIQYTGMDEMINKQIEPFYPQERDMPSQNPPIFELRTQSERAQKVAYNKLRKSFRHNGSRNYQEFYLELRTTKYEDLIGEDSGIKFNGLNIDGDEKMISGIENEIVIDWLEGIDKRLPDFIEQKYSSELQTISLYNLQGQISQNLDFHISEIEEKGDVEFQIQFGADNFEQEREANGIKKETKNENEIFDISDFAADSNKLKHVNKLGDEEWDLTTVDLNKTKENISSTSKRKLNPKIETEEMMEAEYSCKECAKCFQKTDLLIRHKREIHTVDISLQSQIFQNLNSHHSKIEEKRNAAFKIQISADNFEYQSEANGIEDEVKSKNRTFDTIDFRDDSNKLNNVKHFGEKGCDSTTIDFNKTKENISINSKPKLKLKIETEDMVKVGYSCEKCGKCFQQTDFLIRHKKEIHGRDINLQGQISQSTDYCLPEVEKKGYQSEANGMKDEVKTKNGILDIIDFTNDSNKLKHVDFNKMKKNIAINSKPKLNLKIETEKMIKAEYSCEKCGNCFQQIDLLIRHKKEMHTGDIKYTCDHCDSTYKSEMILRIHVKATHLLAEPPESNEKFTEKSLKDTFTEKSFKDEKEQKKYTVIHTGNRPFKCDECDKSFKQKYDLKMHNKLHSGIAEYICDICSKEFYEISKLVSHKIVHSEERTHSCDRCGKCFKRPGEVIRHSKLVHDGEKREIRKKMEKKHTCEQCGKSFITRYDLVEHIRTHTGEKPFICEVCNKSFAKEVNLKVHKRLHTKQFPFKCDLCNSAKNELMQLKKHKLTVHGIEYKP